MDTRYGKEGTTSGIVYLVGAGPGDPGLITVKGLRKVQSADVLVYDYLAAGEIVGQASNHAELIYVGKKGARHTLEQAQINTLLIQKAREGKTIVRLKGGDPYVFGRGGEEAQDLRAAGVPFEIVPGVTSAVAAPAYAGIPVTHRDHASMVTFVTGHEDPTKATSSVDWSYLAACPGTLVFLMGVKNLPTISNSLIQHGKAPDLPAALVRWGTTPRQVSLFSTLGDIPMDAVKKGIKAPAVLVVGSVAALHTELGWFEQKPLFGKRILVTRGREQSRKMAEFITEQGGDPILFPTIEIVAPNDFGPVDEAIKHASTYDWIIFTSVNGVERFFARLFELNADIRSLWGPKIGAIGPITAQTLTKLGLKVDLLAKQFIAEGVLDALSDDAIRGKRFLIPRAETAREALPEGLKARGGEAHVVSVYRTVAPERTNVAHIVDLLTHKAVDAITFTSSSTVTHFKDMLKGENLGKLLDGVRLASIGPITSETLRKQGLPVDIEAEEYTVPGLLAALRKFYSQPQC